VPFAHDIFFREAGASRAGPPVVLVHGAGMSSSIFVGLVGRLGRRRRTVALDLPGHGRSRGAVATVEEMRDTVGALAATLCLGRSILVGHSLGGLVALAAALEWPDKIAGLALVTTGARLKVSPAIFETLARGWDGWPAMLAQVAYSPESLRRSGFLVAASQGQTIADFEACAAFDARARLAELRAPATVVVGEHDLLTPPRWGTALAEGIAGARLVSLPRCGHLPMHERPDELARALEDLIDTAPRT
jgi:pimeloyl-ACP methyl ester carboxylesterase